METTDNPIANPLDTKKRSFEEMLSYLANKYPNHKFGVQFNKGTWVAMAQAPGKEPLFISDSNFVIALNAVIGLSVKNE